MPIRAIPPTPKHEVAHPSSDRGDLLGGEGEERFVGTHIVKGAPLSIGIAGISMPPAETLNGLPTIGDRPIAGSSSSAD